MTWLVAGLVNPGDRYARTRHNLGRMVVEELARAEPTSASAGPGSCPPTSPRCTTGDERLVLAKSQLYYNESGPVYASLAKKHRPGTP